MATLAMFRAAKPEFNGVSDALVTMMLALAAVEMDTTVWGQFSGPGLPITKADSGQMELAAHKLAVSPFGQNAKTVVNGKKQGYARTSYGEEFMLLRYSVTSGFRVA